MLPVCFIPCESMESPAAANTVTPASTRYLRKFTGKLDGGALRLSFRAIALRAAKNLGELRDVSRPLRHNTRAFGSHPYQALTSSAAASSLCFFTILFRAQRRFRSM